MILLLILLEIATQWWITDHFDGGPPNLPREPVERTISVILTAIGPHRLLFAMLFIMVLLLVFIK